MPRPKPAEPWVNIVVRLTPDQAALVRRMAANNQMTVSDMFREMVCNYDFTAKREPSPSPSSYRPAT